MPLPVLLTRAAVGLFVLVGGALAAVGGVSLGLPGLVAVALAAGVAACLGAGIARDAAVRDPRQAAVDAAWRSAVVTVAVLLVLSGCAVLAGGAMTVLLAATGVLVLLVRWAVRRVRADRRAAPAVVLPLAADDGWVRALSVPALGREWVRTSAALAETREPVARQELVRRRQEALDELERRDPEGFARWLSTGATVDSDPAEYVSGDPTAGYDAA
ncbi:hypothetical protein O2W15_04205 [Modestobacter sp. VKM Ac-2979]|uniref:hypothetical protein n=1 Tax=unclassified Modestobacter TaxID=2643866 RepID=UPI0022AB53FA|nr:MULTISPECIES: hypothetical protein [unclassified Modestobacter]MCZ2810628.1 hypothetical protein [Modestobacter sp. VKM Ac-2979]MCZ2842114.1 hypothetical protein [Modestobacter sp. VKM Ac-2980]